MAYHEEFPILENSTLHQFLQKKSKEYIYFSVTLLLCESSAVISYVIAIILTLSHDCMPSGIQGFYSLFDSDYKV